MSKDPKRVKKDSTGIQLEKILEAEEQLTWKPKGSEPGLLENPGARGEATRGPGRDI